MVRGLELFRDRFRDFTGSLILIGGAACDEWFTSQGLVFRSTTDLDLVIVIEDLSPDFIVAMTAFVTDGGYTIGERSDGVPILYRFAKPQNPDFPAKLEFCSRSPDQFVLGPDQAAVPVFTALTHHSLSALLLDDNYYDLVRTHHDDRDGLWLANATSLIPLKAYAWLRLTERKAAGDALDSHNITKHRNDIFRLAATLPTEPGPTLAVTIVADLTRFLAAFPDDSPEWTAIDSALKATLGSTIPAATLRSTLQTYFRLNP